MTIEISCLEILKCLKSESKNMIKNTAILICEITEYEKEISQLIMNTGGISDLIEYLGNTRGHIRLPGIKALGRMAAHSETLAMAVIVKWVS